MKATATITGLVLLLVAAPVAAQDRHGVIAFGNTGESDGVAYGFAWNFLAEDAAHAAAMNACMSGGGTDCIEFAWFQNSCGALAMDQYGNAQGKPGMTQEQAEARALQGCEAAFGGAGCNIVGSVCTAPDGESGIYSGSESVLPAQMAQTTVTEPADESTAREEPAPLQDARTVVTGPVDELLAREERILIQHVLNALGFDAGSADGIFGPRTLAAIYYWQRASGYETTGQLTREQAASLVAQAASLAAVEVSREQEDENSPPTPDADEIPEGQQEAVGSQSGKVLTFPEAGRCEPEDARVDAIEDFIYRLYGEASFIISLSDQHPTADDFELYFKYYYVGDKPLDPAIRCEGFVIVDHECKVRSLDGDSLESEAARRQTFDCEPGK